MKKIGIYGGSFDPIHHAHLILARETLETLDLSEVIFVPAAQSPHKADTTPAPAEVRWEMITSAIRGEPRFAVSRVEIDRPPPSYTVTTVEELRALYPDAECFFLLGEDNFEQLGSWHRFEELRQMVKFVVLDRSETEVEYPCPTIRRKIDISATTIRNRVASGHSIRYLVPEAVEQIIRREKLYQGKKQSNPKN